ncbi:hypothetical protein DL96DRAFT_720405 [Flagelloscypha sp. PMI_526]|nr:hypothetical protein DL96DRAFT_720405 [Flagelloscypha sp. PMI_526]
MDWRVNVLSTQTSDTSPSILVEFPDAKYAFNVGEGSARSLAQSKSNWKKTRACFLTSLGAERCTGLTGTLMSFADSTVEEVCVVGGVGLTQWVAGMRFFTYRNTCSILTTEIDPFNVDVMSEKPMATFKDANAVVYSFPVFHSSHSPPPSASAKEDVMITGEKRKRDSISSADAPSPKKFHVDPSSSSHPHPRARSRSTSPPPSITGDPDQDFRLAIIKAMFPGTHDPADLIWAKTARNKALQGLPSPPKPSKQPKVNKDGIQKSRRGKVYQGDGPPSAESSRDNKDGVLKTPGIDEVHAMVDLTTKGKEERRNGNPFSRKATKPLGFFDPLPKYSHPSVLPHAPNERHTLAYVLVGPTYRGKFNAERAKELQIPSGFLRGQLSKGIDVTFTVKGPDGEDVQRTVKSSEIMGKAPTPSVIIVLDVPTPEHIPSLVKTFTESPFYSRFHARHAEFTEKHVVRVVYHMLGRSVFEDPRYVQFMNGFDPETHHCFSSSEHNTNPITYTGPAYNQIRMAHLDSSLFSLPHYSLTPHRDYKLIPNLPANVHPMRMNQVASMRPFVPPAQNRRVDAEDLFTPIAEGKVDVRSVIGKEALKRMDEAREVVEKLEKEREAGPSTKGDDVCIWTLGTGSAQASKYRNVSATLIQIPDQGNILLDCGEGTWCQILRAFGDEAEAELRKLKCIFVSHIHADHHAGLVKLLSIRRHLDPPPTEPLYLVSILRVHMYLRELSDLEDLGLASLSPTPPSSNGVISILAEAIHYKNRPSYQTEGMWAMNSTEPWTDIAQSKQNLQKMRDGLGLTRFETVDVMHRTPCYGVVIEGQGTLDTGGNGKGWSIVFSGDTVPAKPLISQGAAVGTTVLIHEATLSDEQKAMARDKHHSTFGQAIEVGKEMKAEHILLTHFSARYPKLPPAVVKPATLSVSADFPSTSPSEAERKEVEDGGPTVAMAFDNVRFRIGSMWKMRYYLASLEDNYMETRDEEEELEEEKAVLGRVGETEVSL